MLCHDHCIRDDYELPSISLLTRLTTKISKIDDSDFLKCFFANCEVRQRNVILLIDEIYVKPSLTYQGQGGNVFGKAINITELFATTVVSFMIFSLFSGKKFLL